MRLRLEDVSIRYGKMLYVAALSACKNREDAEDAVQDACMQYLRLNKDFESAEHIKAWLLRVTINRAINYSRSFWRKHKEPLEDYMETLQFDSGEDQQLIETLMELPDKYRITLHLFYYDDYSIKEIADILKISESAVKSRLVRGRSLMKQKLQEEWEND